MTISSTSQRLPSLPLTNTESSPLVSLGRVETEGASGSPVAEGESARAKGDSALAQHYAKALRTFTGNSATDTTLMVQIPPESTFGRWWTQLGNAAKSHDFVEWRRSMGVIPGTIRILPASGQITHRTTLDLLPRMRGDEDKGWSAVRGPLMDAGRVLSNRHYRPFPLPLPGQLDHAPAWLVGNFYFERQLSTPLEFQQRAAELERDKTFEALPAELFSGIHEMRSDEALDTQKSALGNSYNRREAIVLLDYLRSALERGSIEESEIQKYLRETTFTVARDSSYTSDRGLPENGLLNLQGFLDYHGIEYPATANELANLQAFLQTPTPNASVHGNYGGAFSWPQPLDAQGQRQLSAFLLHGEVGNLNLTSSSVVLEALMQGIAIEPSDLRNPQQLLDRLIQSAKGQALGEAISTHFEDLGVAGSANDWLMAALNMDFNASASRTPDTRKQVAGFDLTGPQLKAQPLSKTLQSVADHIYTKARLTMSSEKALILAHLLMASRAPELLVKDIPATITHGSIAHVNLSIAVARIEAETPGRAATLSYGEVMLLSDIRPVSAAQRQIEYVAQHEALKEWGVTNTLVTNVTTPADMKVISDAYNEQVAELSAASKAQRADVPASRKDRALAELRTVLGDDIRLELKCITLEKYDKDRPGPYSILDLYMDNKLHNPPQATHAMRRVGPRTSANSWRLEPYTAPSRGPGRSEANTPNFTMEDVLAKTKSLPDVSKAFVGEFQTFGDNIDRSVAIQVKNLIAQLPLEDRKIIETGVLSLFSEYKGVFVAGRGATVVRVPASENRAVLIHLQQGTTGHTYEINLSQNTLKKRADLSHPDLAHRFGPKPLSYNGTYTEVIPIDLHARDGRAETQDRLRAGKILQDGPLNSYSSPRTVAIGDTVAKSTSFVRAMRTDAHGVTTFDTEVPSYTVVREFLLNLIPLRSAIISFLEGDIAGGVLDLTLDIFGILTAGAGTASKVAKVATSALSTGSKALRIGKTVGLGAISLVNPLDGVPDLLRGAGRGAASVGKRVIADTAQDLRQLRGTRTSYDLVAARKQFDGGSIGTFKLNNEYLEVPAIFKNNKWYAYDPISRQPYGRALKEFVPSAKCQTEHFGRWATATDPTRTIDDAIVNKWIKVVNTHRNGPEKDAFEAGYKFGVQQSVKGLTNTSKIEDLMKLAGNNNLTASQVGVLVKRYDDIAYTLGRKGAARFIDNIEPRFGNVVPMPQVVYFSQTEQLSDGQCAALSRVMATAMAQGKEKVLIQNMFTAAAFPKDPASRSFIAKLRKLQTQVGSETAFHAGKPLRQMTYQKMVEELSDSPVSKSIMIDSPKHAMAAGVNVKDGKKTFYFYDPNHGLATFSSKEAMERGLTRLFNDKKMDVKYKTHSADGNKLEFKVFDHDDEWQVKSSVFSADIKSLYDAPITLSKAPQPVSNLELTKKWEALHASPHNQGLICYQASIRVAEAEKTLSPKVYNAVQATTKDLTGTNYSPRFLEIMGIEPGSIKTTFNPADITESGLINFKHSNQDGGFGHTAYIQKANNNELYLFNTNCLDLDLAMTRSGNPPQMSGGLTVYKLGDGKGLQTFLDGLYENQGWQFAFTPASSLEANVQKLPS